MAQAETQSEAIRASELSYRRLFEAAKDGILILDADTGRISDVNPFLIEMLGFSHSEMVGKPIWELGPFKDIVSNKAKFEQLQQQGYVRYENLPLETRDGRKIAVEFVSNVYQAGDTQRDPMQRPRHHGAQTRGRSNTRVSTRNWNNASSNARRNCKPPTRNWKRSVIPSPTICARRCAMSWASWNCCNKTPGRRFRKKISAI